MARFVEIQKSTENMVRSKKLQKNIQIENNCVKNMEEHCSSSELDNGQDSVKFLSVGDEMFLRSVLENTACIETQSEK